MLRRPGIMCKIGAVVMLVIYLTACSSSPSPQPSMESSPSPSKAASPNPMYTPVPDEEPPDPISNPVPIASGEPSSNPVHHSDEEGGEEPEASVPPAVHEGPTVQTIPPQKEPQPEREFKVDSPSLAGVALGASEQEIIRQFGQPLDTYPLPGDQDNIEIWEYDGLSLGLNTSSKVVYVEISSTKIGTGIQELHFGMDGSRAAQVLGVSAPQKSNVILVEVTGGWIKLDLDPGNQQVLSLKLLSRQI